MTVHLPELLWFAGLYLGSCIPMIVAGHMRDQGVKIFLLVSDLMLSVASYFMLYLAFDGGWNGFFAVILFFIIMGGLGDHLKKSGYDPYGLFNKTP
jgi:hypothetical protein